MYKEEAINQEIKSGNTSEQTIIKYKLNTANVIENKLNVVKIEGKSIKQLNLDNLSSGLKEKDISDNYLYYNALTNNKSKSIKIIQSNINNNNICKSKNNLNIFIKIHNF